VANVVGGADPREKRQRLAIATEHDVLAVVHELACFAIEKRSCPAAELRPRFQDQHACALFGQQRCGAQTGKAGSDHDNVRSHRIPSIVLAQVLAAISARRGRGIRTTDEKTS
jgi:hypothetical protein